MSTTEKDASQRALAQEWVWARITIVGGFLITIAVAAYLSFFAPPNAASPEAIARARTQANAKASLQLCNMALRAAKNFGIVPGYGNLASPNVQKTDVQGRYVCIAATSVTKYVLAADLICRDLGDQRCVSLYSITQDDGTVLYQRQG